MDWIYTWNFYSKCEKKTDTIDFEGKCKKCSSD